MNDEFDFKAIRAFTYLMPGVICLTGLRVLIVCLFLTPGENIAGVSFFRAAGPIGVILWMCEYAAVVAIFVIIYRLSDMNVWFRVSGLLYLAYIISWVFARIWEWQSAYSGMRSTVSVLMTVFGSLPDIILLTSLATVMKGVDSSWSDIPEGNREAKTAKREKKKLKQFKWPAIASCVLLIIAETLVRVLFFLNRQVPPFGVRLSLLPLLIPFIGMGIYFSLRVRTFGMTYTMYRYNRT